MTFRTFCDRLAPAAALLAVCCCAGPALAQYSAAVDTAEDGGLIFHHRDPGAVELAPEEQIAELNAALKANPADGKSWNDLGVVYAGQGRFDLARDAFINAVQTTPTEGDFHRNLGLTFARLEMFDLAASEFEAYRRLDTLGGRDYWRLIAGAQARAGQTEAAAATYAEGIDALGADGGAETLRLVLALNKLAADRGDEQAVRDLLQAHTPAAAKFLASLEDEDADGAMEARGIIHNRVAMMVEDAKLMEQSDLLPQAASLYEEAYALAPGRDDLLPRLVDVNLKAGDDLRARVLARLARDNHPDQSGTWIATGKVLERGDRLAEAVEAYQKAFAIDPSLEDLRVAIGNLLMRLGRDQEASTFLRAGVNSANTKPEVVYNYAVSLIRDKKYHAAIPSLRGVVRDRPEMVQAWSALAQCLRATKQYAAAVEPYQKTLELAPDAKVAYNLGYCAMKAGRTDTALQAYETALAMDPTMTEARYNLSLTLMDAKRYEEAAASFDRLLEMEPDSYRAYYSQGLSYFYLERYDAALEAFDLAMEQRETANLFNNIGLVYDKLGQKKKAQSYYQQAKTLQGGK